MTRAVPSMVVDADLRPPITHRLRRAHWMAIDAVVGLLLAVAIVATGRRLGDPASVRFVWVFGVAPFAIVVRRRWPMLVLAVGLALVALSSVTKLVEGTPAVLVVALALYSLASVDDDGAARHLAVAGALVATSLAWLSTPRPRVAVVGFAAMLIIEAAAWAMGDAVRYRRAYIVGLARQAAVQAEDARRAERLRIAREVHDVVAHNISVIAVTASVGSYVAGDHPEEAARALAAIESTSRAALGELRSLLGTLRDETAAAETAPTPGIADLDRVVTDTLHAGVSVDLRVEGTPRPVPLAVDLAAYRIVQEALTNVIKHAGPTDTVVRLTFDEAILGIEVSDAGPRPPRPAAGLSGSGHGLVGMRERAVLLGGTFHAGAVAPRGFRVSARLPLGADAA